MRKPVVVVTRDEGPRGALRQALADRGADVRALPTTRTAPADDPGPLNDALDAVDTFDWLSFTSARGVDAVAEHPSWRATWTGAGRPRVAAVGAATAERLRETGAPVDLEGKGFGGSDLAEEMIEAAGDAVEGARILWPRSDRARPELMEKLQAAGAHVAAPIAYRTLPARPDDLAWFVDALERGDVDAVAFLSPSAASGLASALGTGDLARLTGGPCVASIGPTTSAALRDLAAPPDVEATQPAVEELAAELMAHIEARQGVC